MHQEVGCMPIFEYRCRACGESFEHFTQRPAAAKAPACPKCGARESGQVMSRFSGGSGTVDRCGSSASDLG